MEQNTVREEILEATIVLFNEKGLKFTMDDLAKELHRSKKTIYVIFPDKKKLLDEMVDYIFDSIKVSEKEILEDETLSTVQKLHCLLGAMPEKYREIDFNRLYCLQDKYPRIYHHVQERLENGWEATIGLIEQGKREGVIREVSIPVFKIMMQATIEQFFQRNVLAENGIGYGKALAEVVEILVFGIAERNT
jgi:AcrR family transcriptional regulator